MKYFVTTILLLVITSEPGFAQSRKVDPLPTIKHYLPFSLNNNEIWFGNNGNIAFNIVKGDGGWMYPAQSGKSVCFELGLVFGGVVDGGVRVGGSTYNHGLQPGWINADGKASNPQDSLAKIYFIKQSDTLERINPDYQNWP